MADSRPNIILILADDLGYGDLSCYGSKIHRTPHLDRMRQEGVLLTDFYVASPVCSPSRAAIMTGCYPQRVGLSEGYDFAVLLPGDPLGLNPKEISLARLLEGKGYATKLVGKWHLGDQPPFLPRQHGFQSYFGLPHSNDHNSHRPASDRGHLPKRYSEFRLPPLPLMRNEEILEQDPDQTTLTERYTKEAIQFIRSNKDGPFFLFMSHMYVHTPLHPPREYLERSLNGPYGAEVEHLDACTGRLLDELVELGMEKDTLVVFMSDNGAARKSGGSNAPLRGWKAETWEGGMREPCIMWWPGRIPAHGTCGELVAAMDLYATFAGLAGAELPCDRTLDSIDIGPILWGDGSGFESRNCLLYYRGQNLEAVRSGKWKLHIDPDLLYDLETDIGETRNVFDNNPDVVEKLTLYAEQARKELGDARRRVIGSDCRPAGWVSHPRTLTVLDSQEQLFKAEYD